MTRSSPTSGSEMRVGHNDDVSWGLVEGGVVGLPRNGYASVVGLSGEMFTPIMPILSRKA